MDGVDRGDQHRVMGAGFANVAHFKKWYKKTFMGIADFSFLQAFTAWNLSVPMLRYSTRRIYNKRQVLLKWQFYSVAAEEMMSYVDLDEAESIFNPSSDTFRLHTPRSIPKDYAEIRYPHCII